VVYVVKISNEKDVLLDILRGVLVNLDFSDGSVLLVHLYTGVKLMTLERFTVNRQIMTDLLKSHNAGTWFTCKICQKKICHSVILENVYFDISV